MGLEPATFGPAIQIFGLACQVRKPLIYRDFQCTSKALTVARQSARMQYFGIVR
jgi:hypothetical protein